MYVVWLPVWGPETRAGQATNVTVIWQASEKESFYWLTKKKIAHYKVEACQGKFVFIVEGFARFSLEKRLESLPVYSCLLKLDLWLNFRLMTRILFFGKITNQFLHQLHSQINTGQNVEGRSQHLGSQGLQTYTFFKIFSRDK